MKLKTECRKFGRKQEMNSELASRKWKKEYCSGEGSLEQIKSFENFVVSKKKSKSTCRNI